MVGLSDANIFGTGNTLKFKTNFSRRDFSYGGNIVEYKIPNVLGTFYTADFSAGRDFYNSELNLGLRKEFIRPTDYEIGLTYSDIKSKRYMVDLDTSLLVKVRNLDVWGGKSHYIRSIKSSVFLTGRYSYARFSRRPPVTADYNPALHDHDAMLFGGGLYREKFYTANMVYGFGTREYLATGYKAELVSGYSWGEFNDEMYLGMSYQTGGFRGMGYIMGGFTLGSYIDLKSGMWRHSAVDVDLKWFSNLFLFRRSRIRPVPGVQLHARLEPGRRQRRNDPLHPRQRVAGAQRVRHRNQPHDPQHGNGGLHPLPAPRVPHRGIRVRRLRTDRLFA